MFIFSFWFCLLVNINKLVIVKIIFEEGKSCYVAII